MEKIAINALLLDGILRYKRPDMLRHKVGGEWQTISYEQFLRRAAAVAHWLQAKGIRRGDRVATFSNNRPEWHMADLGIMGIGAINAPLYFAESVERMQFILRDSGARLCFVGQPEQLGKVKQVWDELPELESVVTFFGEGEGDKVVSWETVADEKTGQNFLQKFVRRARAENPDNVATLIYTSGTTGRPKGVLLTQSNLGTNARDTFNNYEIYPDDLSLSLLPLCHIYERTVANSNLIHGIPIAYAESFDNVVENMKEVRPTMMAVVPRFFEKFYSRLHANLEEMSPFKRKVFDWALLVGQRNLPYKFQAKTPPLGLRVQLAIADALVFRKIQARLGGRMRAFISGGAPLSKSLNEFFNALGFNVYEGYGLTETSPVISTNLMGPPYKPGTVGPLVPNVEVKIAEDGEILTRGPHVMKGYHGLEAKTAEALEGGWFHTGDIGHLDEDNYLVITDRKKDLLKTAGGKYVAPQPIENSLKDSAYIANAVVVGDRRKFAAALLVPNFEAVEEWGSKQGNTFGDIAEMLSSGSVQALFDAEVEKVNRHLARYEQIKKYALLEQDFSFEAGQLTYTQKVRRRVIEEQFAAVIDGLYTESGGQAIK